jgi:hypothetical protein
MTGGGSTMRNGAVEACAAPKKGDVGQDDSTGAAAGAAISGPEAGEITGAAGG